MKQHKAFSGKYRAARVQQFQAAQKKKKAKRKAAKKNRK